MTILDNTHGMSITRLRRIQLAPMFISLSGGNFNGNKLLRWSSTNPPKLQLEYTSSRVREFDACWNANRLIVGTYDSSII
jgi:hypothetical protein